MTPERWQQIDKVLQAALERPSTQRAAFLDEACAGDEALRKEVESLIRFQERPGTFMEAPALEEAADWLAREKAESMIGRMIGLYKVLGEIAHGGMGEVYLAQDTELPRKIALKLLPAYFTREEERVRRFQREAWAASGLNHPNIITIYKIGQVEGTHFIAMEFVDGQTLRKHMACTRMKLCDVLDVSVQLAGALAAAHEAEIVHRDIKPENIMVRPDGYVKVLDFGIAKLSGGQVATNDLTAPSGSEYTGPGRVMGTVAYMSPEQARGEKLDGRTDLFSFGAVLYEMATGRPAFSGGTAALIHDAILNRPPAPPLRLNPELPTELEQIINKALEKDRKLRYQTASDLGADLQRVKRALESGQGAAPPEVGASHEAIDSIAVLPLANASGDPETEYLSEGITESIINSLSQLPKLRVLPRSVVFRYTGRDVDPQTVGRDLNVGAVLTGRVLQRGDSLIIGIELVDVAKGWQLWGQRYNRNLSDIFAMEQEIAKEISEKLRLRLTGEEEKRLTKRYTESIEAYQNYLKGRYYWEKWTEEAWKKGIEYFQQAIETDPTYARAYAGLADSYVYLGWFCVLPPKEAYPRAKAAAIKALEMDDSLAEAHNSLAAVRMAYDWNWSDAEREFKRAIDLNPNYATAHHWYAEYLKQMGRHDEALGEIKRAQELDPRSLIVNTSVGWQYYFARQYDQAIEQYQMTLEMDPNFGPAHWGLGWAYDQKSMFAEAAAEFQRGINLSGGNPVYVAGLGHALAVGRQGEEAQKVLDELMELSKRLYVPPYFIAAIYTGLGDKARAFEWLEKAYEEHSSWLLYLRVDPRLDSLRSAPPFHDLLRRVGLHHKASSGGRGDSESG